MNPRIKELAKQSGVWEYYEINEGVGEDEKHLEKFAELLIRECAFVAQNKDSTNIDLRYGRGLAAGKIFEHFGY